jgi:hypothetical protein
MIHIDVQPPEPVELLAAAAVSRTARKNISHCEHQSHCDGVAGRALRQDCCDQLRTLRRDTLSHNGFRDGLPALDVGGEKARRRGYCFTA